MMICSDHLPSYVLSFTLSWCQERRFQQQVDINWCNHAPRGNYCTRCISRPRCVCWGNVTYLYGHVDGNRDIGQQMVVKEEVRWASCTRRDSTGRMVDTTRDVYMAWDARIMAVTSSLPKSGEGTTSIGCQDAMAPPAVSR